MTVSALFRMQIYECGREPGPFRPICCHRGVILLVSSAHKIQVSFVLTILRNIRPQTINQMSPLFKVHIKSL
jgi:hypothetical protein